MDVFILFLLVDNSSLYGHYEILTILLSSSDTGIVPGPVKVFLAGIPKTPVSRVAGAIFYAATDRDEKSSGSAWLLVDDGPVFMVPKEQFKQGVYKMIDDRANAIREYVISAVNSTVIIILPCYLYFISVHTNIKGWYLFARDIWRITGNAVITFCLGTALAKIVWDNQHEIEKYVRTILA